MNAVLDDVDLSAGPSSESAPQKPRLTVINGAQKRKINRIVARIVARAVALELLASAIRPLDEWLTPVDRIEQRWAVSIGSGLPTERFDDTLAARPTPLDDVTAIIVDQINLKAPPHHAYLLKCWYKSPLPAESIGAAMGISRSAIYLEWRAALQYLRDAFIASKHPDLLRMLEFRDL